MRWQRGGASHAAGAAQCTLGNYATTGARCSACPTGRYGVPSPIVSNWQALDHRCRRCPAGKYQTHDDDFNRCVAVLLCSIADQSNGSVRISGSVPLVAPGTSALLVHRRAMRAQRGGLRQQEWRKGCRRKPHASSALPAGPRPICSNAATANRGSTQTRAPHAFRAQRARRSSPVGLLVSIPV